MSILQQLIAKQLKHEYHEIFPDAEMLTEKDKNIIHKIASIELALVKQFVNVSRFDYTVEDIEQSYRLYLLMIYLILKGSEPGTIHSKDNVLLYPTREVRTFWECHWRSSGYENDCNVIFDYQAVKFFTFDESTKLKGRNNSQQLEKKLGAYEKSERLKKTIETKT